MLNDVVVGNVFESKRWGKFKIEKYSNYKAIDITFLDTGFSKTVAKNSILTGSVRDPLVPSVYGVGITGDTTRSTESKTKHYKIWVGMIGRCYSKTNRSHIKYYKDCTVSDNFKYYTYFKEWCNKQIGFGRKGYQLDKDILSKGSKIYSEATCCFVPKEINMLILKSQGNRGESPIGVYFNKSDKRFCASLKIRGKRKHVGNYLSEEEAFYAYKTARETYIKEIANEWKDKINPKVYDALMKWEISIDD